MYPGSAGSDDATVLLDVVPVLFAELPDRRQDGRDRRVREDTDRHAVAHLVRDALQEVDVLEAPLARLDPRQHPVEPRGALPAGGALPARLVREELGQVLR